MREKQQQKTGGQGRRHQPTAPQQSNAAGLQQAVHPEAEQGIEQRVQQARDQQQSTDQADGHAELRGKVMRPDHVQRQGHKRQRQGRQAQQCQRPVAAWVHAGLCKVNCTTSVLCSRKAASQ